MTAEHEHWCAWRLDAGYVHRHCGCACHPRDDPRDEFVRGLIEHDAAEYSRLQAERDRLIAAGVDPAELETPAPPRGRPTMNLVQRFRAAYRKRVCPKCHGRGVAVMDTILRDNFRDRPCRLCGGNGEVRYTFRVALTTALAGLTEHPDDHTAEPAP